MGEPTRRDILYIATGLAGVIGAGAVAWPFIDQMRPSRDTIAQATIDVDLAPIEPGMSVTVKWRGRPVVIRNRTAAEMEAANAVPMDALRDRFARNANLGDNVEASLQARSAGEGRENWLIMVNVCTHLGCIPLGQAGRYGGWFCPCHGSDYDTAGRVRSGPANENMLIPPFTFLSDTVVRIG